MFYVERIFEHIKQIIQFKPSDNRADHRPKEYSIIYLGLAYKYYNKLTTLITSADIYIFESHEDLVKNQDLLQYLEE